MFLVFENTNFYQELSNEIFYKNCLLKKTLVRKNYFRRVKNEE